MVLEGVAGIPVFSVFTGIFRRNSCGTGIPVLLQMPEAVWLGSDVDIN